MTEDDAKARLGLIEAEAYKKVRALAAEVRAQFVMPLCRRHRLEYYAGNGVWFFSTTRRKETVNMSHEEAFRLARLEPPTKLLELLRSPVLESQYLTLGDYIEEVRWPRRSK